MAQGWRVTQQRQYEELTPGGTFESVVEVGFSLDSGATASIKIPVRLYTEDYVRTQIEARAQTMMAIENL